MHKKAEPRDARLHHRIPAYKSHEKGRSWKIWFGGFPGWRRGTRLCRGVPGYNLMKKIRMQCALCFLRFDDTKVGPWQARSQPYYRLLLTRCLCTKKSQSSSYSFNYQAFISYKNAAKRSKKHSSVQVWAKKNRGARLRRGGFPYIIS
jgi:hypothetical protein